MQQIPQETLVLGSGSPRRRDLLQRLGLNFEIQAAEGDGPVVSDAPASRVVGHANFKAHQVAILKPKRWVLAADTLVYGDGRFLPKPKDRSQAREMLQFLQKVGMHEVWTGACLIGSDGASWSRADRAVVGFAPIPGAELEKLLLGNEWRDKAGAYAIQGWAGKYATLLEGDLDTVVGLAEITVLNLFRAAGLPKQAFRG
ncbi:MAG: Maf family protein [Planctomycetota bacterium]|nr:Maf family protein [Planctomycetota bacterium]MDA1112939.1 Maf family protein [Planctomycetota bacterium]